MRRGEKAREAGRRGVSAEKRFSYGEESLSEEENPATTRDVRGSTPFGTRVGETFRNHGEIVALSSPTSSASLSSSALAPLVPGQLLVPPG